MPWDKTKCESRENRITRLEDSSQEFQERKKTIDNVEKWGGENFKELQEHQKKIDEQQKEIDTLKTDQATILGLVNVTAKSVNEAVKCVDDMKSNTLGRTMGELFKKGWQGAIVKAIEYVILGLIIITVLKVLMSDSLNVIKKDLNNKIESTKDVQKPLKTNTSGGNP